jgi:hypothetical protein
MKSLPLLLQPSLHRLLPPLRSIKQRLVICLTLLLWLLWLLRLCAAGLLLL